MNYEKTVINDQFDTDLLECQYFAICKAYTPGACMYGGPCKSHMRLTTGDIIITRNVLSNCLEASVSTENLKFQIDLLKDM